MALENQGNMTKAMGETQMELSAPNFSLVPPRCCCPLGEWTLSFSVSRSLCNWLSNKQINTSEKNVNSFWCKTILKFMHSVFIIHFFRKAWRFPRPSQLGFLRITYEGTLAEKWTERQPSEGKGSKPGSRLWLWAWFFPICWVNLPLLIWLNILHTQHRKDNPWNPGFISWLGRLKGIVH